MKSAEAGLTTVTRDDISVKDKIESDYNTYNSYLNNYDFLSIMSKRSEVQEILDNHSSIFKNLRTIVAQKVMAMHLCSLMEQKISLFLTV